MSFQCGFFLRILCFLMIKLRLYLYTYTYMYFSKSTTELVLYSSHCIISRDLQFWFVPWLVTLIAGVVSSVFFPRMLTLHFTISILWRSTLRYIKTSFLRYPVPGHFCRWCASLTGSENPCWAVLSLCGCLLNLWSLWYLILSYSPFRDAMSWALRLFRWHSYIYAFPILCQAPIPPSGTPPLLVSVPVLLDWNLWERKG